MGKSKHINKVMGLFEKSPVVDFKSVKRVIGLKSNYAKLLIYNLIKGGKIQKIAKGFYTKYNDLSLVVLCFKPGYLGLQSALSFYDIWEQEAIPVVITSKKARTGLRKVIGGNVLIRRIQTKFIFGVDYIKDGEFYLPYSDIEKTFIDMVVFKQKMSKDIINNFKYKINKEKLKKYLRFYPGKIKATALNYLER